MISTPSIYLNLCCVNCNLKFWAQWWPKQWWLRDISDHSDNFVLVISGYTWDWWRNVLTRVWQLKYGQHASIWSPMQFYFQTNLTCSQSFLQKQPLFGSLLQNCFQMAHFGVNLQILCANKKFSICNTVLYESANSLELWSPFSKTLNNITIKSQPQHAHWCFDYKLSS